MAVNDLNATLRVYSCLVGHRVSEKELEASTEVLSLDQGALVRVCTQHGAPIALTLVPSSAGLAEQAEATGSPGADAET